MAKITYEFNSAKQVQYNGFDITDVNFNGSSLWSKGSIDSGVMSDSVTGVKGAVRTVTHNFSPVRGTGYGSCTYFWGGHWSWTWNSGGSAKEFKLWANIVLYGAGGTEFYRREYVELGSSGNVQASGSAVVSNTDPIMINIPPGLSALQAIVQYKITGADDSNGDCPQDVTCTVRVKET